MTSRTRTRGALVTVSPPTLFRNNAATGHVWAQITPFSCPVRVGSLETMSDVVVKGFKKQQSLGKKFFNKMEYSKVLYEVGSGSGYQLQQVASPFDSERIDGPSLYVYLTTFTGGTQSVPNVGALLPSDMGNLASEVSTRVMSERGRSSSNLWETLAEMDKTIDMFKHPIQKLTGIVYDASKAAEAGRFRGYAKNGMSNLWLAYRYGIRPIVSDLTGICQGLKKSVGKKEVSSRASGQINVTKVVLGSSTVGVVKVDYGNIITDTYLARGFSLDDVSLSVLNNIGFSGKGLITLPWELVRYSFVVDWIANVGDFIGAISPAFGWNPLGSGLTVTRTIDNQYYPVNTSIPSGAYLLQRPVSGTCHSNVVTKSRGDLAPSAIVVKSDFRFDKFTRVVDALTLLGQKFGKTFG